MALYRLALGILVTLILVSCSIPTIDKQADAMAQSVFDHVRKGDAAGLRPVLAQGLTLEDNDPGLKAMQALIPAGEPVTRKSVGYSFNTQLGQGTRAVLTHAYVYPAKTVNVEVVLFKADGTKDWKVAGFHIVDPASPTQGPASTSPTGS